MGDVSKQDEAWPLPKFNFQVDIGSELKNVAFQEVSGMNVEAQVIDYRHNNSKLFSENKMTGIVKNGNTTMKRGVFTNDNSFWKWIKEIEMNTIKRRTITIKLLDESGKPTMTWELHNAWPTKISSTDLKSDGSEVAVDTIEVAYEQLILIN